MSRAFTETESRTLFLDAVAAVVAAQEVALGLTLAQRLEGVASGILGIIEGDYPSYPAFILAPNPVPAYVAYQQAAGDDYWPPGALEYGEDLSDGLVEQYQSGTP